VTRVPSGPSGKLEATAAAERIAGAVRRHLLSAAQSTLRAVRDLLAKLPSTERPTGAEPASVVRPSVPPATVRTEPAPEASRTPPSAAELLRSPSVLPTSYGSDRLVLLARDPHCLYAYWDLSEARVRAVRADGGSDQLRMVLRIYDVTQIAFDAAPPTRFQDFAITGEARSVYAYLGRPASCFVAEVGFLRPDGAFFPLARSQPIWTPRTEQPGAAPGRWMTVGWSERRGGGKVEALATTGAGALEVGSPEPARTPPRSLASDQAASSWSGPAPAAAQRGSWSLVRGRLASPTTVDAPPATRSDG
jgi:hypothetical protein